MSDTNDTTKKPAGGRPPLVLKKTETSTVKQSFSHGRTKAVVVEKKRTLGPAPTVKAPAAPSAKPATSAPPVSSSAPSAAPAPRGVVLRQLTEEEKARRGAAIADARVYETEARKRAEDEARLRAAEDDRLKTERVAAERRKAEEDARKATEAEARRHADDEVARRVHRPDAPAAATAPA
ncbi:MAG TPA: translation initiation factor IF-2 associated domain-containing protein, partial [Rhizomicrobium sp.]